MIRTLILVTALCASLPGHASYADRPEVQAFVRDLAQRHGFVERELRLVFSRVRRAEPVLEAISRPAEKVRPWQEYRATLVTERRIAEGRDFWKRYRRTLERAERKYGVPAQYVVAIIGIETFYGRYTGRFRVMDALTTLAFDYPPRADYFRSELENFLLLARDSGVDVFSVRGSYAGAIGIPQFMPASTRRYAVDFDGDGAIDLRHSVADAIGSVANFLSQHGWQRSSEVQFRVRPSGEAWRSYADGSVEPKHAIAELLRAGVQVDNLPAELAEERAALIDLGSEQRLGLRNFYVITRYNRSAFYASAVADLAQALFLRSR
ncbi:MAG: lytic murein transglycosylase B [Pseudomonadota bacterium]|nr:lytic murein transglycosylase B [Pseudomonadota bacterium]